MEDLKKVFAGKLLRIKTIELRPNDPLAWTSGWKSPFYCDNRRTLSSHDARSFVKLELVHAILENFPEATVVVGVATGAITQGMFVADGLTLPYAYVRPKPKDRGMKNQIEGELPAGPKVAIVKDLVSTGGSSLKAVVTLCKVGLKVVGMVASYTCGSPVAEEAFRKASVKLVTPTDHEHAVEKALETGYIKELEVSMLYDWRKDSVNWRK